jgi:hypothetical protein
MARRSARVLGLAVVLLVAAGVCLLFGLHVDAGDAGSMSRYFDTRAAAGDRADLGAIVVRGFGRVRIAVALDGSPEPFWYVCLESGPAPGEPKLDLFARTRHDGVAEFPRVPPGRYQVWSAGPRQDPPVFCDRRMNDLLELTVEPGALVERTLPVRTGWWPKQARDAGSRT